MIWKVGTPLLLTLKSYKESSRKLFYLIIYNNTKIIHKKQSIFNHLKINLLTQKLCKILRAAPWILLSKLSLGAFFPKTQSPG